MIFNRLSSQFLWTLLPFLSVAPLPAQEPPWAPAGYCEDFQTPPPSQWVGQNFIFLTHTNVQAFDKPSFYQSTLNALAGEDLNGQTCKVVALILSKTEGQYDFAQIVTSKTHKTAYVPIYPTLASPKGVKRQVAAGEVPGHFLCLFPEKFLQKGRDRFLGRKVWTLRALNLSIEKPGVQVPIEGFGGFSLPKFSTLKIVGVQPGYDGDRPLHFLLQTDKGEVGGIDLGVGCEGGDKNPWADFTFLNFLSLQDPRIATRSTPEQWSAILQGQVLTGMTPSQIYLSLGRPNRILRLPELFWSYDKFEHASKPAYLLFDGSDLLKETPKDDSLLDSYVAGNEFTPEELGEMQKGLEFVSCFDAAPQTLTRVALNGFQKPKDEDSNPSGGDEPNNGVVFRKPIKGTSFTFWSQGQDWYLSDGKTPRFSYRVAGGPWDQSPDDPKMVYLGKGIFRMFSPSHGSNGWGASLTYTSWTDIDLPQKTSTSHVLRSPSSVMIDSKTGKETMVIEEYPMVYHTAWPWLYLWNGKEWEDVSAKNTDYYKEVAEDWRHLAYAEIGADLQDALCQKYYNYAREGGPGGPHPLKAGPSLHAFPFSNERKVHRRRTVHSGTEEGTNQ